MHKTHWSTLIFVITIGLALSAIPANSAAAVSGAIDTSAKLNTNEGELIHGLVMLGLVIAVVVSSRILKTKKENKS